MRTLFQPTFTHAHSQGPSVAGVVPGGTLWVLALLVLAGCVSPEAAPTPPPPALHPAGEDSILSTVELPDGYAATVFARPPQISYLVKPAYDGPVFVAIDKNGSLGTDPGRGSVAACYDDTEDGVADRCTSFVPDLDSPRGVGWDGQWLYVLHPPHLSAFRDTDGDGVLSRNTLATPKSFLKAVAPFREDHVLACECIFC